MRTTFVTLVSLTLHLRGVESFWRMICDGPIVTARMDPIVSPDEIASHTHSITGASGIGYNASYEDLRNSQCTTCQVTQDHSAYWVPQLYYEHQNGTYESVGLVTGITTYYLQRGTPGPAGKILAIPNGLRMIAGDPFRRSYNESDVAQRAIGFSCLGGNGYNRELSTITNCPNGLRQEIFFPNCWDGVNLDSANHQSHMAYSGDDGNYGCPDSHPVKLVSLFYEVMWGIDYWSGSWWNGTAPPFVFAQGDPTGLGSHGDFMSGWDADFLQTAVDTCNNNSGRIEDCAVFDINYDAAGSCAWEGTLMTTEDVNGAHGGLEALPGCNPVYWGPDEAPVHPAVCPNSATPNALVAAVVSSASSSSSSAASSSSSLAAASSSSSPASSSSAELSNTTPVSPSLTGSASSPSGSMEFSSASTRSASVSQASSASSADVRSVSSFATSASASGVLPSGAARLAAVDRSSSMSSSAPRSRFGHYHNTTRSSSATADGTGAQLLAQVVPTNVAAVAAAETDSTSVTSDVVAPTTTTSSEIGVQSAVSGKAQVAAVPAAAAAVAAVASGQASPGVSDSTDSPSSTSTDAPQVVMTSTLASPKSAQTDGAGNVIYVTIEDIEYVTVTTTIYASASPYVQLYVLPKSVAQSYAAQQASASGSASASADVAAAAAGAADASSVLTRYHTVTQASPVFASMAVESGFPAMGVYSNTTGALNATLGINGTYPVGVNGTTNGTAVNLK